jgi:hypothetical protein
MSELRKILLPLLALAACGIEGAIVAELARALGARGDSFVRPATRRSRSPSWSAVRRGVSDLWVHARVG